MTDQITVFETDHRLRKLVHTNATVHNAHQLALRDGDDVDALIMAVLVLAQIEETLTEASSEGMKRTPPTLDVLPRALLTFTNGTLTIASDITLDEARYVIEQLATMVTSRGTMRELTIESEDRQWT